jgi:Gpi18-like mannosyltransferase
VVIFPAWLAGRPMKDLLKIYFLQTDLYAALTHHAPNLYQWISNELYKYFFIPGVIFAGCMVFLFVAGVYLSKVTIDKDVIVSMALISVLLLPYTLPKMHDRYFLAADLIAIVFAFYFPRYFYIPIAVGAVSFFSYFPFLLGYDAVPGTSLAAVLAVVIIVVVYHFARLVIDQRSQEDRSLEAPA